MMDNCQLLLIVKTRISCSNTYPSPYLAIVCQQGTSLHCPPSAIQAEVGFILHYVEAEKGKPGKLHPSSHLKVTYVMFLTFQ